MGGGVGLRWPSFSKYIQQSNGNWRPGWFTYWEGRAARVERTGGHSAIVLAVQLVVENIIKKIHRGLRWPPIDVFDSTTNQKHAGVTEEVHGKRFDGGGARGNGNAIVLGAIELGRGEKIK
jgi:hypothetical protein